MHRQEEGEPVDLFITLLYWLAEQCNYRDLQDEMIGDWIVVGLRDSNLSERLQTDTELTLDKAIMITWGTEAVRQQQAVVRGKTDDTCTRIKTVEHSYSNEKTTNYVPSQQDSKAANKKGCTRCSSFQHILVLSHEATCCKCKKQSHYQLVCRSLTNLAAIQTDNVNKEPFLGAIKIISTRITR